LISTLFRKRIQCLPQVFHRRPQGARTLFPLGDDVSQGFAIRAIAVPVPHRRHVERDAQVGPLGADLVQRNLNKYTLNRSKDNKQPPPVRLLAQAQIRLRLLVTGYRHWVVP
jgi:hypothetical protein